MKIEFGDYLITLTGKAGHAVLSSNLKMTDDEASDIEPLILTEFNAAIDGVESLLLALFAEGVINDANENSVTAAVEAAIDAILNNMVS